MANKRIYELTAEASPALSDLLVSEDPAGATDARKITITQVKNLVFSQVTTTFDNGDLSSYAITVTHNLNTSTPKVWVYDGNGKIQTGISMVSSDANNVIITIGYAISGTWTYLIEA